MTTSTASRTTGWLSAADCSLDDFAALVEPADRPGGLPLRRRRRAQRADLRREAPRRDRLRPPAGARCRPS